MDPAKGAGKDHGVVVKRRDRLSDEELRKLLIKMPEIGIDNIKHGDAHPVAKALFRAADPQGKRLVHPFLGLLPTRPDLSGLPIQTIEDSRLNKEQAENLQAQSKKLRELLTETERAGANPAALAAFRAAGPGKKAPPGVGGFGFIGVAGVPVRGFPGVGVGVPADPRLHAEALKDCFAAREELKGDFLSSAGVSSLMQLLFPENSPVRKVLADELSTIEHPSAAVALARIALFDVNDEVRAKAVQALAQRPKVEYRQVLLDGFRYPWAPVADHAAEALVALGDKDAIPDLEQLVTLPDPSAPTTDDNKRFYVREVVRVNHMRNCLMCHAPSAAKTDPVRAPVPTPGQPLAGGPGGYGAALDGAFVRADVTYLRQDFSVAQPVDKPEPWPVMQRYDYLVRKRAVSAQDAERLKKAADSYPQRDAVLYALRELAD
jgi:HEAT repeat protein